MRAAMADYVATVHQAYVSQADMQTPAVRGRMPLLAEDFTVVAAGAGNLHVIATVEDLARPDGPEVAIDAEIGSMKWTIRFYDPVVLPQLGAIDESSGPRGDQVRQALGITTRLYHLIVQPGSQLTSHHAGHAGSGLANAHIADARDFAEIRALTANSSLVDEMEGAARAGLNNAQILLARELAPPGTGHLSGTAEQVRRGLLEALRETDAG